RHAERLALERITAALVERALDDAGRARRDPRPRAVERLHRDLEAAALFAEQVLLRYAHVLEDDVVGQRRALAHLGFLLADLHAGRVHVDDERGDALVAQLRVQRRERRAEAGDAAVGDPALLPVQDVLVALLLDARAHAGHVAARVRLAARVAAEDRLA